MKGVVVFFLGYALMLAALSLNTFWQRAHDPAHPPAPRRLTNRQLRNFGGRQLLFTGVLVLGWLGHDWTRESVGIPAHILWPDTILAGEVGFLAVLFGNLLILWVARRLVPMRMAAVRANLRIWPRGRKAKWFAALFIMIFNPIVEELVMRGILIHKWGLMLGSPALPIAVGFLLNAVLHWYQGWRFQLWHAQFFVVAVLLLYSPWGLPAAIVAHVFGDVLPIVALRHQLKAARKARRRERRSVTA